MSPFDKPTPRHVLERFRQLWPEGGLFAPERFFHAADPWRTGGDARALAAARSETGTEARPGAFAAAGAAA